MEEVKKNHWKTVAIVFIVLFTLETVYLGWSYWYVTNEDKKTMKCYYEICEDYPEAVRDGNLCTCYDYDLLGDYVVAKTRLMD